MYLHTCGHKLGDTRDDYSRVRVRVTSRGAVVFARILSLEESAMIIITATAPE